MEPSALCLRTSAFFKQIIAPQLVFFKELQHSIYQGAVTYTICSVIYNKAKARYRITIDTKRLL